jgi:LmbE family N-acetylglucosaminyl deacetylase
MKHPLHLIAVLVLCAAPAFATAPAWPDVTLSPDDRVLVLAPHPDDEVIATGGIIQQAVKQGLPVHVVFYTFGDNNEWAFTVYRKHPVIMPRAVQAMGMIRHGEALRADAALGLAPTNLTFLGYPDFGTLVIWSRHWGDRPPFRSMLTRVTAVPYTNAFRCGAPYTGESILSDLKTVIRDFRPTKIFSSHPGDHNPDHRSLYLFTRVALWDMEKELKPVLLPYLVHYKHWPMPQGFNPDIPMVPPELFRTSVLWHGFKIAATNVSVQHDAMRMHASQYKVSAAYLDSFLRPNELFGDFPPIVLRQANAEHPADVMNEHEENDVPGELTDEEKASYIGIETRSMWLEGSNVVLSMKLSRPLAETVEFRANLFGYREGRPFAEMPKILVNIGVTGHKVLDQDRALPRHSCEVIRHARQITIKTPLSVLGNPDRILTSARTAFGDIPMDWVSWRVLHMPPVAGPE